MLLTRARRRAATIAEAALVLPLVLVFLFAIFEYCRFIFLVEVAENAAREGARYAVARTGDGTAKADVQAYVTDRMAGRQNELTGFTVDVLAVDPATGLQDPNAPNWNDAPFGGAILVRVSGTYTPMLPGFLGTATSVSVNCTSMMTSEAN
jgi:Flp pilus assembly protein TadG